MTDLSTAGLDSTRYRFIRTLGSGGFAEVTCVERLGPAGFRRVVALKRPHTDDPTAVERLLREARIGGLLRHESIVGTLDVERDEAGWYLVLEYVDGPTLSAVLARHGEAASTPHIPVGAAFGLALQLCAGLEHAHAAVDADGRPLGLVHGDLSPANLLLTRKGQLKIADFGAATSALGRSGSGRGTPGYAAPEVARHEPIDLRADVFAAGAILRALFARTDLRDDPALGAILARATALAPDDRYPDACALAAALTAIRPAPAPDEPSLEVVASGWVEALATLAAPAPSSEPPPLPARPYRGLDSFGPESRALFFGRHDDALRIARRIRSSPVVVLTGASGAGKSSVLAAGLPAHLPDFAVLRFRPGPDPVTRLARLLGVAREAVGHPTDLAAGALAAPTILVVDQAEELLTLATADGALEVARALVALADAGLARVVFSVRADHLAALCDLEPLRGRAGAAVELLSLPSRQQLVDALVRPLEPFGYRFETPELVDRIVSALVGRPGALALLQFCADRLWDARDQERAVLRAADLDALGGVEGALTTYADRVLEALAPAEQEVARQILVRCLHGGARHPLGVPALLAADWAGPHAAAVLERLVEARLLARRADPEEGAVVEPAHEALAAHWQRLARWVTQGALAQQVLGELIRAAAAWERAREARGGHADALLWTGGLLSQWLLVEADLAEHLGPSERRFVEASVRQSRRRRRVRVAVVSAVVALSTALTLLATFGWRQAADSREEAEVARRASEVDALLARSARHRERSEMGPAVALARQVLRADPTSARAIAELYAAIGGRSERVILAGHADAVRDGAFTPDGAHVVTVGMDGTARIWDREGRLERAIDAQMGPAYRVRVSPAGDRFTVVGSTGVGRIYRLDGTVVAALELGEQPALAAWDRTGERLVVTGVSGKAVLFGASGDRVADLATEADAMGWAAFAPDGGALAYVALGGRPGKVFAPDGRVLAAPVPAADAVFAEISAKGQLITASWPGCVQLFDGDGKERARVTGQSHYPVAGWSRDGSTFVAGAPDDAGAVAVMSADGAPLRTLSGHRAPVFSVALGSDGLVATGDERGEVRVFAASGETLAVLEGHAGRVWSLAFSADGTRLLSTAEDGTARLWEPHGRSRARIVAGARVDRCQIDPRGERVLTITMDDRDRWSEAAMYAVSGERLGGWRAEGEARPAELRWRPDGAEAVARDVGGAVTWLGRDGAVVGRLAPESPVRVVDWQGTRLVGGTEDGHVAVLTPTGEGPRLAVLSGPVTRLAMTSGLRGVAAGAGGLRLFDLERQTVVDVDPRPKVLALCWSPDGARFVVGRRDASAELRDAAGKTLAVLEGHREQVAGCAWHPSSERFATASWDGNARIWSRDGVLIEVVGGHRREVQTATWSPDGRRFLTTEWSGVAHLRDAGGGAGGGAAGAAGGDAATGARGALATFSGHGGELIHASWATDAPLIATCAQSGHDVRLWPADDAELLNWASALVPEADGWRD